jgi:hypothetical protein
MFEFYQDMKKWCGREKPRSQGSMVENGVVWHARDRREELLISGDMHLRQPTELMDTDASGKVAVI